MFRTLEEKPAHEAGSKSIKILKTLCKGVGHVLVFCKSAVLAFFDFITKVETEHVLIMTAIVSKNK